MEYSVISMDKAGNISTLVNNISQTEYDQIVALINRLQEGKVKPTKALQKKIK